MVRQDNHYRVRATGSPATCPPEEELEQLRRERDLERKDDVDVQQLARQMAEQEVKTFQVMMTYLMKMVT